MAGGFPKISERVTVLAVLGAVLMLNACGQSADVAEVPGADTASGDDADGAAADHAPSEGGTAYAYGFDPDSTPMVIALDTGTAETTAETMLPWEAATSLVVAAGSVWVGTERQAEGNLLRLDPDTLQTQASISVPDNVQGLFTDGNTLVALTFSGLTPIDTIGNAAGAPYVLYRDQFPKATQVEAGKVYAVFDLGNEGSVLAVYDAATGAEEAVTAVDPNGSEAADIAVVDGIAWVSLRYSGNVVRVDPGQGQVLETLPVLDPIPTSAGRVFGLTRVGDGVWAYYTDEAGDGVTPLVEGATTAPPEPIVVDADTALVAIDEDTALGVGGFGPDVNRIDADGTVEPFMLTTLAAVEFSPNLFAVGQ